MTVFSPHCPIQNTDAQGKIDRRTDDVVVAVMDGVQFSGCRKCSFESDPHAPAPIREDTFSNRE